MRQRLKRLVLDGVEAHRGAKPYAALAFFSQALEQDPSLVEAWVNQGLVWMAIQQPMKAIACFERAVELRPSLHQGYSNLGVALSAQGDFEQGLSRHDEVIRLAPMVEAYHHNRGNALRELGRTVQAHDAFVHACVLDPKFQGARWNWQSFR